MGVVNVGDKVRIGDRVNDHFGKAETAGQPQIPTQHADTLRSPLVIERSQDAAAPRVRASSRARTGCSAKQSVETAFFLVIRPVNVGLSDVSNSTCGKPTAAMASKAAGSSRSLKRAVEQLVFFMASLSDYGFIFRAPIGSMASPN